MARPHRGKKRRGDSRDWIITYLMTGIEPTGPEVNPFEALDIFYDDVIQRAAWEEHRHAIMTAWRKPGCRPFAWWQHDAPRLPLGTFPGYKDGTLPEPRRHLGGPGKPRHEQFCYAPSQFFGIWSWYGDPDNPPIFETQFSYLERHGLLAPGEQQVIAEPHPGPERIEDAQKWEALKIKLAKEKISLV